MAFINIASAGASKETELYNIKFGIHVLMSPSPYNSTTPLDHSFFLTPSPNHKHKSYEIFLSDDHYRPTMKHTKYKLPDNKMGRLFVSEEHYIDRKRD